MEKLGQIFAPADAKGVSFIDRFVLYLLLGADDVWVARPENPAEKKLMDVVADMSLKMNIAKPPRLVIYTSPKPNAASLATGSIAVGTAMFEVMTPPELEAVIGHELAHHRHRSRDLPVMLGIPLVYDAASSAIAGSNPYRNMSRQSRLAYRAADSVGLLATNVLIPLAYTRSIEYEADKEAAEYTGRPQDMIGALKALERRSRIINELRNKPARQESSWSQYFQTHPPTASRIERLQQQEQQMLSNESVSR